jgi:aflatoxin B1 aldehyde reductase
LRASVEKSLSELKTSKLDICYLHAPDYGTPFDETVEAMDELHKEGKVDVFGISNFAV